MAEKKKTRKVRVDQKCDYCDQKTKYIGAIDFSGKIYRVCENHKDEALKAMKEAKGENGKTKS